MLVILAYISGFHCHALLTSPVPRTDGGMVGLVAPGIKQATFPPLATQLSGCLKSTKTFSSKNTYTAGNRVTLNWTITIAHPSDPGVRVAIQYGPGKPMTLLKDKIDVNAKQAFIDLDNAYSGEALLQWMWVSEADGGFYMACADLNIVKASLSTVLTDSDTDTLNTEASKGTIRVSPSKSKYSTTPTGQEANSQVISQVISRLLICGSLILIL
jgi:hypothetical protein